MFLTDGLNGKLLKEALVLIKKLKKQGDCFDFFITVFNTSSSAALQICVGFRTVAISALAVRRSNHSARSQPQRMLLLSFG
jgi:hypothetical protein